ncbi:MAG: phosphoenolpyruvate--protein phosphotransferase [Desulfobacteraceae bacterium]|nr:MAG: phosphoenolpyruvate--protein phosphotransferase [Desulfobacteraceae bacterium]
MNMEPMTAHQLKGIAVSPGIIIGKARLVDRSRIKIFYKYLLDEKQARQEVQRFDSALQATKEQIRSLKNGMPDQIKQHAFILDAQLMIIDDSMFGEATVNTIVQEKINAEWALQKSIHNIHQLFEQVKDDYIHERITDVDYVAERVLRNLTGKEVEDLTEIRERVIIVAHELSPADTTAIDVGKILGFITDVGGQTSHTSILARSLKIPAVVGLETATQQIQDGILLIVDGNNGEVLIDPDDELIIQYQEKQLQQERYQSRIAKISHLPATTKDSHRIITKANIEFLDEVREAREHGAEGVGLYRTEYLYMTSKEIPSEEELFEDYRQVAKNMAPAQVTFRTLDIGGEKFMPQLAANKGLNPALGLRAIRFCLREPKIFKTQLRAILRASIYGKIELMFPMIADLQEVFQAKAILNEVMAELDDRKIKYQQDIKVGVMIEVPSAVAIADILAKQVDFFSIGTNDLIQYALAIDRANEHVAYMYQPFHPAILRMIRQVVQAGQKAGIRVAICGEMAADPLCTYILLGMGFKELSMNFGGLPIIKELIRSLSYKEAQADLKRILKLDTADKVQEFVLKRISSIMPDIGRRSYIH